MSVTQPHSPIRRIIIPILLSSAFAPAAIGQATVRSTDGYSVTIQVTPKSIVLSSTNCQYGYNYEVLMDYSVVFSGPGAPSNMYILQGTIGCGANSLFFNLPTGPSSGIVTTQSSPWRNTADCATATLSSLDCNTITVHIQGPGIPDQIVPINPAPLPITLVEFTAVVDNGLVDAAWTTASESDNDHFSLERSKDAEDFTLVVDIPGAGNSTRMIHYKATDRSPYPGISYYRLKQTDTDGAYSYSQVVAVDDEQGEEIQGEEELRAFPNPSNTGEFELSRDCSGDELQIISLSGVVVFNTRITSNKVSYPPLPVGIYLVRVIDQHTGTAHQFRLLLN